MPLCQRKSLSSSSPDCSRALEKLPNIPGDLKAQGHQVSREDYVSPELFQMLSDWWISTCASLLTAHHLQGQGPLWVDPEGKILFLRGEQHHLSPGRGPTSFLGGLFSTCLTSDTCRVWASQSNELKEDSQARSGPFLSIKHQVCPRRSSFRCWGWNPHGACSQLGRGKHKSSK